MAKTKLFEDTILKNVEYAVVIIDTQKRVSFINDATRRLLNCDCKDEDILGKHYTEILRFYREGENRMSNEFIENTFLGKNTLTTKSLEILTKDSKRVAVDCSASGILDIHKNFIGSVIVFRDVTEGRYIEKTKSEFVSIASHQLRTPLVSIRWYAEALLNGVGGVIKPTDKQKEYLEAVYDSTLRIISLVNALLNVSRLEMGTFAVEPQLLELKDLACDTVDTLEPEIKLKGLKVEKLCDPNVPKMMIDPDIMGIIFQNLISNSIKYSKKGGNIIIEGKVITDPNILAKIKDNKDKSGVLISVKDDGIGIPSNQQKEIFTKLFRADNIKKLDESGTGLGLYTTKMILDNVGGAIWFESEENKGSTFYVLLPESGMKERAGSRKLQISR